VYPQSARNDFLVRFKENSQTWMQAKCIIDASAELTQFFGVQVFEEAINTRWKIMSPNQRATIRTHIVNKIANLAADGSRTKGETTLSVHRTGTSIALTQGLNILKGL